MSFSSKPTTPSSSARPYTNDHDRVASKVSPSTRRAPWGRGAGLPLADGPERVHTRFTSSQFGGQTMEHSAFDNRKLLRGAALCALVVGAVVAALLTGVGTVRSPAIRAQTVASSSTSPPRSSSQNLAPQGSASPIDAGQFAGSWGVHGTELVIRADGSGMAEWRTYEWCGTGSPPVTPPCDRLVPDGAYELIISGGHAQINLTVVSGSTAEALIGESSEPSRLPDGPVTLTVAPDDVLTLTTGSLRLPLCGPQALALTIPQQDAEGINCGA